MKQNPNIPTTKQLMKRRNGSSPIELLLVTTLTGVSKVCIAAMVNANLSVNLYEVDSLLIFIYPLRIDLFLCFFVSEHILCYNNNATSLILQVAIRHMGIKK